MKWKEGKEDRTEKDRGGRGRTKSRKMSHMCRGKEGLRSRRVNSG